MKYVTHMNELFHLSDRAYKKLIRDISEGVMHDPANYGKSLGVIEADITDMQEEEAQDILTRI